jgi:single-stranded-DNA-specific exonuclease
MAFRAAEADLGAFLMKERGQAVHLAGTLSADSWQGSRRMQFRVLDAAKAF